MTMKRSKKYVCLFSAVLLIVGLGFMCQTAAAQPDKAKWPKSMIIEGMSVGSSAYMVAAGLGKAINDELGIRTQVTAGVPPAIEVENVGKGESQIAYAVGETPYDAYRGEYSWKGKQQKDLRVMTHVISVAIHFITWPGTGIDSAADLKGKRVMGDQARVRFLVGVTKAVLAENGLTDKDVKIITWREWGEQVSFIRMKLGDAIFLECGVGTAPIAELDRTMKLKFVPFKKNEIEAALVKNPYLHPYTIQAGSYTQLKKDYYTVGASVSQVVNVNTPDSLIYEICKILYDKPGRFESVHSTWGKFDIKRATITRTAPYHAGAVKYYKEKGLWSSDLDKWQKKTLQEFGLEK
jgi:TRAP transporter TAXI family solute receptor